jgi:hypothetical protein
MLAQDMRVNLRCAQIIVAQELLYRSDISAILKQMCRKGMAEGVGADLFAIQTCLTHSNCQKLSGYRIMQLVAAECAVVGMGGNGA